MGHRGLKPVEFMVWRSIVALWLAGWLAVLAGAVLDAAGLAWAGAFVLASPEVYGRWRRALARRSLVRCDWADSMPAEPARPRTQRSRALRCTRPRASAWCRRHAFAIAAAVTVASLLFVAARYTPLLDGAITTPLLELQAGL